MREITISKKLIRKLAIECFDYEITDTQIEKVGAEYDLLLEHQGGIVYIGDVADIIYDVIEA